jgi:hypothetical protein
MANAHDSTRPQNPLLRQNPPQPYPSPRPHTQQYKSSLSYQNPHARQYTHSPYINSAMPVSSEFDGIHGIQPRRPASQIPPPNRQPLASVSNNVQTVQASDRKVHISNTIEFRKITIPTPDRYLSFYEFESTYCTIFARDYTNKESFSNARRTWLRGLGLDIHPYNTLWTTQSGKDEVETIWARRTALTRRIFEWTAIRLKYAILVEIGQIPLRAVPPKDLPLPFSELERRYFNVPE